MKVIDIRSKIDLTGKIHDKKLFGYPTPEGTFYWCEDDKLPDGEGRYLYPMFTGNIVHIKPFEISDCSHSSVTHDKGNYYRCNKCGRDLKPNWIVR